MRIFRSISSVGLIEVAISVALMGYKQDLNAIAQEGWGCKQCEQRTSEDMDVTQERCTRLGSYDARQYPGGVMVLSLTLLS